MEEATMLYKTIILELIQDRPELYERLRSTKRLLPTVDAYAIDLRASHETWKGTIGRQRPESDPTRISSEALELAIEEIRDRLPSESATVEAEGPSLDGAMSFLRKHSPLA
jgi:hypothetical protein